MKNLHLGIISFAFITILVALYYGVSIQNAQDNFLTAHLYLDEGESFADLDEIPTLGFKAAIITTFFLVFGFTLELFVYFKTNFKRVKNLAIGALICYLIIFGFDILFLISPKLYNFRDYGMIWVLLSLTIIFINGVSIFVKK